MFRRFWKVLGKLNVKIFIFLFLKKEIIIRKTNKIFLTIHDNHLHINTTVKQPFYLPG